MDPMADSCLVTKKASDQGAGDGPRWIFNCLTTFCMAAHKSHQDNKKMTLSYKKMSEKPAVRLTRTLPVADPAYLEPRSWV